MRIHRPTRYAAFAAMSLLYLLLMAGTFNSLGVVLPLMVRDLALDWGQAGFGFTLLGVACGLASMGPAVMIRRLGVAVTLLFGAAMLAAGFVALALAHGVVAYQAGALMLGIGFCFCGTVPGIHVISVLFERRASTALGLYFMIGGLGSVAGPLLFYGVHRLSDGWRPYWTILAAAAGLFGLFGALTTRGCDPAARADRQVSTDTEASGWTARAGMRSPRFWIVVAAYTGCLLVNTTVHGFAAQHLNERGLSLGAAAGLLSTAALISAVASSLTGMAAERVSPRALTLLALAALGLSAFALTLPQSATTLALFTVAIGVGLGVSYVSTAGLLLDWFGRRANLELYSLMCVVSTSAALGPALGGIARDASGSFVATFAALAAAAFLLFLILLATRRPVAPDTTETAFATTFA